MRRAAQCRRSTLRLRKRVVARGGRSAGTDLPFQRGGSPSAGAVAQGGAEAGLSLIFTNHPNHDPLDQDLALLEAHRLHGGIGGLEPDPATGLTVELLDRSLVP